MTARETAVAASLIALGIVMAMVAPAYFAPGNLRDLLLSNLPVLIVAIGSMLVILTGEIDISCGSMFAICSVLAGMVAKETGSVALAFLAAVSAGHHTRQPCRTGRRLWPDPVHRRDAGNAGGVARRIAVGDRRRLGDRSPARVSVVRIETGVLSAGGGRAGARPVRAHDVGLARHRGRTLAVCDRLECRLRRAWLGFAWSASRSRRSPLLER